MRHCWKCDQLVCENVVLKFALLVDRLTQVLGQVGEQEISAEERKIEFKL